MSEMIYTMAGTRFFISEDPVEAKLDVEESDFAEVVWVEVQGLFNVGELGSEQGVNEFELINSDWMLKAKGTRNGGTVTNTFIPLAFDPGQIKFLEAIEEKCSPYAFKIERGSECAPEGEAPSGMTQMFQGLAVGGAHSGGSRNDAYTRTYGVAVYGRVIEV